MKNPVYESKPIIYLVVFVAYMWYNQMKVDAHVYKHTMHT